MKKDKIHFHNVSYLIILNENVEKKNLIIFLHPFLSLSVISIETMKINKQKIISRYIAI